MKLPIKPLRVIFAPLALLLLLTAPLLAQESSVESQSYVFEVETVVDNLEHPWAIAFLPDGRFLVTERDPGTIRVGDVEGQLSEPVHEVSDLFSPIGATPRSQAGLFDIKLHPNFEANGLVYWVYSRSTERGSAVVIQRGIWDGDSNRFRQIQDVWVMQEDDQDSSGLHFGGRMAWLTDGTLVLSIGERRNLERAQDLEDQAGGTIRMTMDGDAPADNPDWGEAANEYVYTAGSRNIQALGVHPQTGALWAADHGPKGGDEINLLEAGNNYGWPFITGGVDYSGAPLGVGTSMEGKVSPVHIFEETIAPSGLTFVWEESALDAWNGDMLIGGLYAEGIVRVRLHDGRVVQEELIEIGRRIRDVRVHDGSIWVVTEHSDGEVLRLRPTRR
jgi:aldose sugar dehydrogenase